MIIQAGAARQVLADAPNDAADALLAVESSGREAMTELRTLLGLLAPGGSGEDDLTPQPGMSRLDELVDRVAFAGLPVELTVEGQPRPLPPGIDLTAYRVIQEALTNVLRHAPGARADGPRPLHRAAPAAGDRQHRAERADRPRTLRATGVGSELANGRGLLGLRERVAVVRRSPRRAPPPRRRIPGPGEDPAVTRVLIADDQALVRTGFTMILAAAGIEVVGQAADGVDAVRAGPLPSPGRDPDGHPDAAAGRSRSDPAGPGRPAGDPRHHADHLRPRPVRLRRAGGRAPVGSCSRT